MAKVYNKRPSEILGIEDEYTAFCFDEACAYIQTKMEAGEEPEFIEDKIEKEEAKKKPKVNALERLQELQKHL